MIRLILTAALGLPLLVTGLQAASPATVGQFLDHPGCSCDEGCEDCDPGHLCLDDCSCNCCPGHGSVVMHDAQVGPAFAPDLQGCMWMPPDPDATGHTLRIYRPPRAA